MEFEGRLARKLAFCNPTFADGSGMAASRLQLAAAACVILLRCAAESRKSHCNGSVRRVNGALAADFFDLALMIFLIKFLLKRVSKSSFFRFGVKIRDLFGVSH